MKQTKITKITRPWRPNRHSKYCQLTLPVFITPSVHLCAAHHWRDEARVRIADSFQQITKFNYSVA